MDDGGAPRFQQLSQGLLTPFERTSYLIARPSGVVMTKPRMLTHGGYHLDFRGLTPATDLGALPVPWECEYFCRPEAILQWRAADSRGGVFLNYLNMRADLRAEGPLALADCAWAPSLGHLGDMLPSEVARTIATPPVRFSERTLLQATSPLATTRTVIRNLTDAAAQVAYVYQDAAYLWFPRASQAGVVPVFLSREAGAWRSVVGRHTGRAFGEGSDRAFSGYVDLANGVAAGISLPGASAEDGVARSLGCLPRYLGFDLMIEIGGHGFALLPAEPTLEDDGVLPDDSAPIDVGGQVLRSLFVRFAGELAPGAAVTCMFQRLMLFKAGGFASLDQAIARITAELDAAVEIHV